MSLLVPTVSRETFRIHETLGDHFVSDALALKVFKRDGFCCQGCGFSVKPDAITATANPYFILHHHNHDHSDHGSDNLVSLCRFCHSILHAGAADANKSMQLIFCPWLSQAEINLMANLIISALLTDDGFYCETAETLYGEFQAMRAYIRYFDVDATSFTVPQLSAALLSLYNKSPEAYQRRGELLAGLRFFPEIDAHEAAAKDWKRQWPTEANWPDFIASWQTQNS